MLMDMRCVSPPSAGALLSPRFEPCTNRLARVSVLHSTVEELLFAALLSTDRPNVALRLATRHYHGWIDVARLLEARATAGSADGSRSGGGLVTSC